MNKTQLAIITMSTSISICKLRISELDTSFLYAIRISGKIPVRYIAWESAKVKVKVNLKRQHLLKILNNVEPLLLDA